jgi:cell division protease FtsH
MLVLWLMIGVVFFPRHNPNTLDIPYSTFKKHLQAGRVEAITIKGETITGTFKEPVQPAQQEQARTYTRFATVLPSFGDADIVPLLEQ